VVWFHCIAAARAARSPPVRTARARTRRGEPDDADFPENPFDPRDPLA
jgi:hypothetical protein